MSEQITYYHDTRKTSPYCFRVEIALVEAGASYTAHGLDIYNKPAWFARANPLTGKIPAIIYGGPKVPPEEPSPLSFKLTESYVILEFLADLFPSSTLLPPVSDPIARARVRFFMDVVTRSVEATVSEFPKEIPETFEKLVEALEKIQALLPDPDAVDGGGEFAIGKNFTIADCAFVPTLALIELAARTNLGRCAPGTGKRLVELLERDRFARLKRYRKALWERESVKTVVDLDRLEGIWRARFSGN